jgi:N,N-dimethylformamidase
MRALCDAIDPRPGDPLLTAAYDFARGIGTDIVHDRSANRLHGRLVNMPTRAVTGANWDGSAAAWKLKPEHYGAIHFHEDDMADAGWQPDFTLDIPADWPSGFYALRLRGALPGGEEVDSFASFFIRAPLGRARAPMAFVASTATFLAYANSALRLDQIHAESMLEGLIVLSCDDVYLQEHRELGLSTYDTHTDESGWIYSTALRPILNMRPRGNTFNYVNDTHFISWLEEKGLDYDVITDDDIHRDGAALLRQYRVVVTGSHPEYYSREMWDAFDAYQRGGGRHMYLGGNGFYWRIAWHPTLPSCIEVRREDTGVRTWEGEAGEGHHAFTGESAGLWRSSGRPPQRLVGVGFDAQVFDFSSFYRQLPDARDPRAAFIFEGVAANERIGDFGLRNGGAAGLEIDRADATLGSPPNLLLVASADRIGYGGMPTPEEFRTFHRGLDGEQNARVRADMTFFPTANGGAVFTTGSIAWVCSLPHNNYDNNVSRVTENVLRRFLDPAPFEGFS